MPEGAANWEIDLTLLRQSLSRIDPRDTRPLFVEK